MSTPVAPHIEHCADTTPAPSLRRVAVVGAGIAGLAAAFDLVKAGIEVTVVEAGPHAGGKLRTTDFVGLPLDEGADAFLARVPWAVQLCEELGLGPQLRSPDIGAAQVVHHGRLHPLPSGLMLGVPTDLDALEASGLLSSGALAEVRADADRPAARDLTGTSPSSAVSDTTGNTVGDVALGALVRARLGDEAFEVLVDPLLSGVNAGRADELSAELGAMQILTAARADASLVRGARQLLARATASTGNSPPPPVFLSVPGGMGRLVGALVEAIGPHRMCHHRAVTALQRHDDGYHLSVEPTGDPTTDTAIDSAGRLRQAVLGPFDGVVLACPAPTSAALLAPFASVAAGGLAELRYASVALVALAYRPEQLPGPLAYSGFLVPRRAGRFLTACSWSSAKFAHLGADGTVRLRASVGRSDDTRFVSMTDQDMLTAIAEELRELMGIHGDPFAWRVHRWMNALPQYQPGHAQQVAKWEADLAAHAPEVVLAGASLRGLGIPACIASGRHAARSLLAGTPIGG
ncbi:MAG: protoporphyrinogen oxidase [Acidimicrobiales bacterium]